MSGGYLFSKSFFVWCIPIPTPSLFSNSIVFFNRPAWVGIWTLFFLVTSVLPPLFLTSKLLLRLFSASVFSFSEIYIRFL